jgi:hypothetical protein
LKSRYTQRDKLLQLLRDRAPDWVPLPDILRLGVAQYNARIFDLRRLGHRIESRQEGERSWFRLVRNPSLFGDLSPIRWRDDG